MAQSYQGFPIDFRKNGFTLIEMLVSVMMVAFAVSAIASLFRHTEYSALKARIEGRVAALSRYHSARMLYLPYNRLVDPGLTTVENGFLYHPADGSGYADLYPYTVRTTFSSEGSLGEEIRASTSIEWEEPSPNFSSPTNLQKRIDLGSHVRRKF